MSKLLSRIPDSSDSLESPQQEMASSEDFLKLVVDNAADYGSVDPNTAILGSDSSLNRLAREGVFKYIIAKTLDNPNHPYYSLIGTEIRKEMIERITAVLNSSHYLIPSKKQV